jgi:hypothetical protein
MTLKEKIVNYRAANKESRVLLGVLLGEFEKVEKGKDRNGVPISDAECVTIVKKLISSNIECGEFEENETLKLFIPTQLTPEQVLAIVTETGPAAIAVHMRFFKEHYPGLYDSADVLVAAKSIQ